MSSNELDEWKGGYQHLQGMWQHKVAKQAAAKRQIQEFGDYLHEIIDPASVWPKIEQDYDTEFEENV